LGFQSGDAQEDINTSNFISLATVLHLTPNIVQQTIILRKLYKIKVPDAIIAATAMVNNFTLLSHNLSDFNSIEGLRLIDSYTL
jgi:predicted nucleic acid-binding protein